MKHFFANNYVDNIHKREYNPPRTRMSKVILAGAAAMASTKAEKSARKKKPSLHELLQAMLVLQGWNQQLLCAALDRADKRLRRRRTP